MFKTTLTAIAALVVTAASSAYAQVKITELNGKYQENNVIRVTSRVKMPAPPAMAYQVAMIKVAAMAAEKGYSRFAVVKIDDCGTILINGGAVAQMCKIFAQMVTDKEVASPKGENAVKYYAVKKREDGLYLPVSET